MRHAFSDSLRQVIRAAEDEAKGLNQEFVGTEHLMLGLLDAGAGEAARAIAAATAPKIVKERLLRALPKGAEPPVVGGRLPFSPKAQRVVNDAIVLAQAAGESRVTTRFLALSLLQEDASASRDALAHSGADLDALRQSLAQAPATPEP